MSELDANIMVDGQKAVATLEQTGPFINSGGEIDATAIIQTASGPQKVVKTYSMGGGAGKPRYVATLPEVGEEGILYLVETGQTRYGYAIFQEFTWNKEDNSWAAIGAYDVGIDPTGILYQESFDAATNTLNLKTND